MRYLLTFGLAFWATGLHAAHKIDQTVTGKRGADSFKASHTWIVDDGKFHLTVESSLGKTIYLFNGRVFYVCSALNTSQLKYLRQYAGTNKQLMDKFANGACQTVPANFLTRFFLSPAVAVESIDQTEGMRVTVDIPVYDAKAKSQLGKCNQLSRNYQLTKKDNAAAVTLDVKEESCMDASIDWRKSLWREVAKTVLRQPGGTKLMNTLRKDNSTVDGFFRDQTAMVAFQQGSKSTQYSFALATDSVGKIALQADQFSVPKGYAIIHPDSVSGIVNIDAKSPLPTSPEGSATHILMCALTGSFLCLVK